MAKSSKDRSEFHRSGTTNTMFPAIKAVLFTKCLQSLTDHFGIWSWVGTAFGRKSGADIWMENHHVPGLKSFSVLMVEQMA